MGSSVIPREFSVLHLKGGMHVVPPRQPLFFKDDVRPTY